MKLPITDFPPEVDINVQEAFDFVRQVINGGRYQLNVLTSAPTWTGNNGEFHIVDLSGSGKWLYIYVNDTWMRALFSATGCSFTDADGDTKIQLEESTDEDKIRFDTGGTEAMVIDDSQDLYMTSGKKIALDGSTKDFYAKFNSTSDYMEFYVNGALRLQI